MAFEELGHVYMLASKRNGTLYVGVTSDLVKRIHEDRNDTVGGFTKAYHVHRLVCYATTDDVASATKREREIKKWERVWFARE